MNDTQTLPSTSWLRRNMPMLYVVGATCLLSLLGLVYALLFKGPSLPAGNVSAVSVANVDVTKAVVPTNSNTSRTYTTTSAATTTGNRTSASSESEISDLLDGWVAAARAHDLNAQMNYYAETLDVYYKRQGGAGKENVRQDRSRAFEKYSSLDVNISDINIAIDKSGETATATFDKTWKFTGEKSFSGSVRQMVWLTKIGGYWLITGEKDLKVHYVSTS